MSRLSVDLDKPPRARIPDEPLPPNVRRFPIVIDPMVVYLMWKRQEEITLAKAVARHKRREARRYSPSSADAFCRKSPASRT